MEDEDCSVNYIICSDFVCVLVLLIFSIKNL